MLDARCLSLGEPRAFSIKQPASSRPHLFLAFPAAEIYFPNKSPANKSAQAKPNGFSIQEDEI